MLAPLPATRFELSGWKTATVQFNYHIAVDGMLSSVPFEYIKKKVDVGIDFSLLYKESAATICSFVYLCPLGILAFRCQSVQDYVRTPNPPLDKVRAALWGMESQAHYWQELYS